MDMDRQAVRRVGVMVAMLLGAAASTAVLSACNTIEGVGEDVGAAGDAVDEAAEDAND